jgi:hypothetical protein
MRDRAVAVDVLFASMRGSGAAFEQLRDQDASGDGEDAPDDDDVAPAGDDFASDGDDAAPDEVERAPIVAIAPPPEAEPSFAQHHVYGEARAYGAALKRLLPYLRQRASRIAGGDPQLEGDLTQEALIELWEIDASRFDEDDQPYLKQALVRRMYHAAEREFAQEMLVPRARARAFVKLRKEIGPSIHHLGPHPSFTFSDSEET